MANKVMKTESGVVVRIDDCYTTNEKHFLTPFERLDGTSSFFGSFKFLRPQEAKQTLREAVKLLGSNDTVFEGEFPKWREDNYGTSLRVSNRVRFFQNIGMPEEVPDVKVRDFIYSIEIHLKPIKESGDTFLRVARAIAMRASDTGFNDDLYDDWTADQEDSPF